MATPFQVPVSWKRRLTPEKRSMARADGVVLEAGFGGDGDGRQRVEGVVVPEQGNAPALDAARAAGDAPTERRH